MRKSVFLTISKAALSVLLIWWLTASVDLNRLRSSAAELSPETLAGATALFVLQALILGWRWHRIVVLLGGKLPPVKAVEWVFVGLFFNQALPTSVGGDITRMWNLHRLGTAHGLAFASVAIERVTGIAALGLMISLCVPTVWDHLTPQMRIPLIVVGPALVMALGVLAFIDQLAAAWLSGRVLKQAAALASGLRIVMKSGKATLEIAMLGGLASLVVICAASVLGRDLAIDLPLSTLVVVVGGAVLFSVLPISLGGWGVREATMVTLFNTVGVATESALALALIWALLPLLVSLPAGLLWWARHLHSRSSENTQCGHSIGNEPSPPL